MRHTSIAAGILLLAVPLFAQTPTPVPSQFATAHSVFLASAGAAETGRNEKLISQMVYTSLYHAISAAGHYHLVDAPANAELAMTISVQIRINSSLLHLEVYDTKTHTLLWAIDEPLAGAFREKSFQHNVDQTVAALMGDLTSLANGNVPSAP